MEKQDHFLEHFFSPESVAIVGATNNAFKMNFRVMQNLLNFHGQVYPVNPNANEILGIKAFPGLRDIPDKIDLVVSAVPASKTMDIAKRLPCHWRQASGYYCGRFFRGWR